MEYSALFFYNYVMKMPKGETEMNITKLINNDNILSQYDFEQVYIIILRLKDLGYIGLNHFE